MDGADLATVFNCWGQADVGPSAGVPEPTGLGLLAIGVDMSVGCSSSVLTACFLSDPRWTTAWQSPWSYGVL